MMTQETDAYIFSYNLIVRTKRSDNRVWNIDKDRERKQYNKRIIRSNDKRDFSK